jgi:hypothetical protein
MYRKWKKIEFCWFRDVQKMEGNRIHNIVYEFGNKKLRVRPRNKRQDELREGCRIVCVEVWQEKLYNRDERKKLLRTAMNRHILHMAME